MRNSLEIGKFILAAAIAVFTLALSELSAEPTLGSSLQVIKQYCFDCHGAKKTKGDINLEKLVAEASIDKSFKTWELVVEILEFEDMPPEDETQPTDHERQSVILAITDVLDYTIQENAGDPGEVTLRQLTSSEYAYTIKDLTGLDLDLEKSFMSEAVGGEGFSNVGDVQFMQDATLERYLAAAKTVASHALIGAGPLAFYEDVGQTGQELSAINRIDQIYKEHGFRSGAGEGAEAFGLDQYPKAFFTSWRYYYRKTLGLGNISLEELAGQEEISPKFAKHIWSVLSSKSPGFPTTEIVELWKSLPPPSLDEPSQEFNVREACYGIYDQLLNWQKSLASSTQDDEEYAVLTDDPFQAQKTQSFAVPINRRPDEEFSEFEIFVKTASGKDSYNPVVLWKNPRFRMRAKDQTLSSHPLRELASSETMALLKVGTGFDGEGIDENDFVTYGVSNYKVQFANLPNIAGVQFLVEVVLDTEHGDDALVRIEMTDGDGRGDNIAATGNASVLLADPESPQLETWKTGLFEFAQSLPQVSHREATPSDRDRIPLPFDNAYNKPERNYYHTAVKYHRYDNFLTEKILDRDQAQQLEYAWTDLLTSFDFHDTVFRFTDSKYNLQSPVETATEVEKDWIKTLPDEAYGYVQGIVLDYNKKRALLKSAEAGHLKDALSFAEKAWRRPLKRKDRKQLDSFYQKMQKEKGLGHDKAIRLLITRILVAPEFLYRIEQPKKTKPIVELSDYELASRLSYFLWSSPPDAELMQIAEAGELRVPENLAQQARRMLSDTKARRFATEFFGQWFGFYRFDDFNGIDSERFAEFTDALKADLYDESISFFEHIVSNDRPVDDILFADYTFLNVELAKHYNIPFESDSKSPKELRLVNGTREFNRGGLLQQGTILAATSAPLRTSAVKRGDWVLRRILDTPTPPPPADAGSIPAEEVLADGLTVRQRLEAHRRDVSCINCHTRIDPLGFALENFNPLGQWRDTYSDGGKIETTGILNDGTEITGMADFFSYLEQEKSTFYRNLSRKLLGYALGRGEILSDRLLIDKMLVSLDTDKRFSNLVIQIVMSKQFRHKRGQGIESAKNTEDENQDSPI